MTTHKLTVELDMSLYELSDANGDCIAKEEGVSFELDSDNDVLIQCSSHYFINEDEFNLLEKAKELTQDDWDCIALNQLLED